MKVTTERTLSGCQEIFLQPIIKDRPNIVLIYVQIIDFVESNRVYRGPMLQGSRKTKSPTIMICWTPTALDTVSNQIAPDRGLTRDQQNQ